MTATLTDTQAVASLLEPHYPVRRIRPGHIELVTAAATLDAVSWLRDNGIDAVPAGLQIRV